MVAIQPFLNLTTTGVPELRGPALSAMDQKLA